MRLFLVSCCNWFFSCCSGSQYMLTYFRAGLWQPGILVVLLAGCSQGANEPTLVEGGGTVTYKGAPLANAVVTFIPKNGPLAMGRTDLSGKFKLMTGGTTPGVAVGPAAVTVEVPSADTGSDAPKFQKTDSPEERKKMQDAMMKKMTSGGSDPSKDVTLIPKKYSNKSESNLNYTVSAKASENNFTITLT